MQALRTATPLACREKKLTAKSCRANVNVGVVRSLAKGKRRGQGLEPSRWSVFRSMEIEKQL